MALDPSQRVRGLPAIPVISFDHVSMTDAGALFLSWIIERHKYAQVDHNGMLWMRSKDEPDRAAIDVADNEELTTSGLRLLSEVGSPVRQFCEYYVGLVADILVTRDHANTVWV